MSQEALFPVVDGKYKMEKEPVVRIGIVLEEDEKNLIKFKVPAAGYTLESDEPGEHIELNPEKEHRIDANGDWVQLDDQDPLPIHTPKHLLRIIPPSDFEPRKAGDGILVKEVVAGRGFHWQKNIDQTLSHVIEFRARDGALIMINEIPLETYLIGVITGEMSGECPIEFMKAQAIAARSWLLGQPRSPHPGKPFLWCNDDCCQRYQGTGGWSERAVEAIDQCRGEVLITKTNHYCDARYSKSTGGISEDGFNVWKEEIEGLTAMVDAPEGSIVHSFFPVTEQNLEEYIRGEWANDTDAFASPKTVPEETITRYLGRVDEQGQYFRWKVEVTQESLVESLTKRSGIKNLKAVHDLVPRSRGKSGRLIELDVIYTDDNDQKSTHTLSSEYKIREGLSMKFLFSSAIIIEKELDDQGRISSATLHGAGWGHGAGLCQIGGLGRAIKGQNYDEILLAYYSDVRLEKIYP